MDVQRPVFDSERGYFDKWEVHCALVSEDIGPCQLPDTSLFSENSLVQMLKAYQSVYIKPIHSWGGHDISKVWASDDKVVWHRQGQPDPQTFSTMEAFLADITCVYPEQAAVIQQTAPVVALQGRPFDIRVHMQRERDDSWVFAGALARVAGKDSIVSNVEISHGNVLPTEEAFTLVLPRTSLHFDSIHERLRTIGTSVCAVMDQYHAFDEIGVDLGLDAQGDFWVFEVNTNDAFGGPSHELFSLLPDSHVYEQIQERHHRSRMDTAASIFQQLFGMEETEPSE